MDYEQLAAAVREWTALKDKYSVELFASIDKQSIETACRIMLEKENEIRDALGLPHAIER
jgi:hypothetical protein